MDIFISTTTFGVYSREPLQELRDHGLRYTLNQFRRKLSPEEIGAILKDKHFVGLIAGTETLNAKILSAAQSLRVISRVGVGLDTIDLDAARKRNITIYNTPAVLTDAVAELTIGLMLCCLRKIVSHDRRMHNAVWQKEMGVLLKRKTVGVIGLGNIGKRVAHLAKAFGAHVIFYDKKKIRNKLYKQVRLNTLLKDADIISLHCTSSNQIISKEHIARMKKGVCIINTSRGGLIDENALYKGLKTGQIRSAGLDVFNDEPYTGKLTQLDNVVLTPHIGSYAKEARIEMEKQAVLNLIKGLKKVGLL